MLKPTSLSIAFDNAPLDKSTKLLDALIGKIKNYNREVEKSNKLLREQESLRRKLNVRVVGPLLG